MSTPMSPKLKLEGLDLYAPRRARAQDLDESEGSSLWARRHAQDGEPPEAGEIKERVPVTPGSVQVAHERLDDAIRRAIDMARLDGEEQTGEGEVGEEEKAAGEEAGEQEIDEEEAGEQEAGTGELRLPPAPNLPPPQGTATGRLSAIADAQRPDRDAAQAGARRRRQHREPNALPRPPHRGKRRVAPLLLRFAVMIGFAAIVAYGVTVIGPLQSSILPPPPPHAVEHAVATAHVAQDRTVDHAAEIASAAPGSSTAVETSARLVVQNKQSFANQPVELGISVYGANGHESLLLAGLKAGTRLSAGEAIGDTRWQLALNELHNVYMYAPKDFVGVMNTAVNLLSPTAQLVDTRPVQFAWVAQPPKPPANPIEPEHRTAPVQPKDQAQEATLLKRGEDLLAIGDIAGARRVFQYLADAGNAEGALALGATFDARFLTAHNAIGVVADDAKARSWYRRAADLGSTQAKTLLAQTAEK
jgi:hypothetical protein